MDIEEVRSRRGDQPSRMSQAAKSDVYPRVHADIALTHDIFKDGVMSKPNVPREPFYHTPEEEIR